MLVELCNSRVNILKYDENTLLEEAKNINFSKLRAAIKQVNIVVFDFDMKNAHSSFCIVFVPFACCV